MNAYFKIMDTPCGDRKDGNMSKVLLFGILVPDIDSHDLVNY